VLLVVSGCAAGESAGSGAPPPETVSPTAPSESAPSESEPRAVPDIPVRDTTPAAPRAVVAPTRVAVPDAEVSVSVQPVGVEPSGLMELPERVDVAGWYRYGPDPASASGTTVIAAHVDSLKYGLGPFARLVDLPLGAAVEVTLEDGRVATYAVASIEKVPKAEIPLDRVFDRGGPPTLVLVTCGGQFDRTSLTYSDNVLVTATLEGIS